MRKGLFSNPTLSPRKPQGEAGKRGVKTNKSKKGFSPIILNMTALHISSIIK